MFPLRRKKDEEQQFSFSQNITEGDARIVVDEKGTIVFASAAFMDLAHLDRDNIGQHNFQTILTFDAPIQNPTELTAGVHKLWVNGNQSTQDFYFDWIEMPGSNGRRFLVGSYNEEEVFNDPNTNISLAPSPEEPPEIAHSSHDDIDVFLTLSRELMIVTDSTGKILRANSRFSNAVEYSATELLSLIHI